MKNSSFLGRFLKPSKLAFAVLLALGTSRVDADPTDPEAQFQLGRTYYYGNGVPVDHKAAAALFEKATAQGHLGAQANLGACYVNGWGVQTDKNRGFQLMSQAAERGNQHAEYIFGREIFNFWHDKEGYTLRNQNVLSEVLYWLRKASAQGGPEGAAAEKDLNKLLAGIRQDFTTSVVTSFLNAAFSAGENRDDTEYRWGGARVDRDTYNQQLILESQRYRASQ